MEMEVTCMVAGNSCTSAKALRAVPQGHATPGISAKSTTRKRRAVADWLRPHDTDSIIRAATTEEPTAEPRVSKRFFGGTGGSACLARLRAFRFTALSKGFLGCGYAALWGRKAVAGKIA